MVNGRPTLVSTSSLSISSAKTNGFDLFFILDSTEIKLWHERDHHSDLSFYDNRMADVRMISHWLSSSTNQSRSCNLSSLSKVESELRRHCEQMLLDFGYFIRALRLIGTKRVINNGNGNIFHRTTVKGSCSVNDLDVNWHMNNSRYLREADFGRFLLLIETGIWNSIKQRRLSGMKDAHFLVSAIQVQYRQSLQWADRFEIHSRIDGWDDRAFYIEQTMVKDQTNDVVCLLLVRAVVTPRSLSPQTLVDDIHKETIESPVLSPSMKLFQENHRIQSRI